MNKTDTLPACGRSNRRYLYMMGVAAALILASTYVYEFKYLPYQADKTVLAINDTRSPSVLTPSSRPVALGVARGGAEPSPQAPVYVAGAKLVPNDNGVFVSGVAANSVAAEADIQAGDLIFKVNGQRVNHPQQLLRLASEGAFVGGDSVRVSLYRQGRRLNRYLPLDPFR
ncbi:PDZ domain-containing protein [Ectothiorhodospiraceae bacterium BW-2]|nr:PDZ domain-containing protein [Ectothiorhodospiraceae bacterium BW-2]